MSDISYVKIDATSCVHNWLLIAENNSTIIPILTVLFIIIPVD